MTPERPIRVSYIYDLSLPSSHAASVQILNTCRALAARGIPTTLLVRELRSDPERCLDFYGLQPHPELSIRPLFPRGRWKLYPPWMLRRNLVGTQGAERRFVLSRGDTAVDLIRWLEYAQSRGATFVYEAHRLGFAHGIERATNARWDGTLPPPKSLGPYFEKERQTISRARGVVCLTEGVRDVLDQVFGLTQPILILPSGTKVEDSKPTASTERDLDVVYAGKLLARKGIPILIEALRRLPERRLCILGGSAPQVAETQEAVDSAGLRSRVVLTGFVEPRLVQGFLRRARVGVCPIPTDVSIISDRFTSPLKLLEMMAVGLPVVASDIPTVRAVMEHGVSGWLVPAGDPDALAEGIRTLLEDPRLAERLSKGALEKVRAFSWENRALRLARFLESLDARTTARTPGEQPSHVH
jgi:glycosyltransferase involved in cell wall biosynthesis